MDALKSKGEVNWKGEDGPRYLKAPTASRHSATLAVQLLQHKQLPSLP